MFHERHPRTFLKSLTWLILALGVTYTVLVLFGDEWRSAMWHASLLQLVKFVFFYLHERVWNKINFGQVLREHWHKSKRDES